MAGALSSQSVPLTSARVARARYLADVTNSEVFGWPTSDLGGRARIPLQWHRAASPQSSTRRSYSGASFRQSPCTTPRAHLPERTPCYATSPREEISARSSKAVPQAQFQPRWDGDLSILTPRWNRVVENSLRRSMPIGSPNGERSSSRSAGACAEAVGSSNRGVRRTASSPSFFFGNSGHSSPRDLRLSSFNGQSRATSSTCSGGGARTSGSNSKGSSVDAAQADVAAPSSWTWSPARSDRRYGAGGDRNHYEREQSSGRGNRQSPRSPSLAVPVPRSPQEVWNTQLFVESPQTARKVKQVMNLSVELAEKGVYKNAASQRKCSVSELEIKGLPHEATEESLAKICRAFGHQVVRVNTGHHPVQDRCTGEAKVLLRTPKSTSTPELVRFLKDRAGCEVSFR